MKKIFLFAIFAIMMTVLPGCSKSTKSYEAIYYILMTGPTQITCSDSDTKEKLETAIQDWKSTTTLTWKENFGSSYSDSDVAAKDMAAVEYFNERVGAFESAIDNIQKEIRSTSIEIDNSWHFSICRDKSSNTLAPSKDVSIIHHI